MNVRKKVSLKFISDEASRRITFERRNKSLFKKIDELVKLTDAKACLALYSPYESNPRVWPSWGGVQEVVSKFMDLSMKDQTKRMVDQETYICGEIAKAKKKLQRLCEKNRDSHMRDLMFKCLKGDMDMSLIDQNDIQDLVSFVDRYLCEVTQRSKTLKDENNDYMEMNLNSNQNMIFDLNEDLNQQEDIGEHGDISANDV